jgi:hypothetical protein
MSFIALAEYFFITCWVRGIKNVEQRQLKIASLEAQVKALKDDEIDMLSAVSQCCMKWQVPIIGEKLKELKEARLAAAQTTPSKEKPWGFSESLEVLPAAQKEPKP